jgi:hypothetical protein
VNPRIPKRIIQTNKSLDLPLLERAAVANIRLLNPDFEYVFFDDKQVDEFIEKEFPEYLDVYYSFPVRIQRYDFFRYLAIYRLGGFYFDMDVFLASSVSRLLEFECVFPFEALTFNAFLRDQFNMDWELGNYAFGAVAGHPFLRAVIENCVRAQKDPKWAGTMEKSIPRVFKEEYYVLATTGPWLLSRTLAEFPDAAKHIKVLFPDDVCNQEYWNRFGEFGVHLMGGSWRKPSTRFKRRLQGYWEVLLLNRKLKESRKLGKCRTLQFR